MVNTGAVVRVSSVYHRHPGKPCFLEELKPLPERKVHFDQKRRRWVAIAIVCCFLLAVMGVTRVVLKFTSSSLYLFESSSKRFNTEITKEYHKHERRQDGRVDPIDNADFDFDVPPVKSDDTLIDPKAPTSSLVVLVLSKRNHFQRRSMIRQTWGKDYASGLYFVIGGVRVTSKSSNITDEIQRLLLEEQVRFCDLLDTVHPESYRGLPHKLRFAIRWVMMNGPERDGAVQWILKVDDDMYIRSLKGFVVENRSVNLSKLNSSFPIVMGQIQYQIPVQRHGKWAEHASYYHNHPIYPPWPKGSSGYLMSRSVAMLIAQKYSQDLSLMHTTTQGKVALPTYQGEDTSLGIWLETSNVSWVSSRYFVTDGQCLADANNAWSIGHQITPELMQKCFELESKLLLSSHFSPSIEDTVILDISTIFQYQRFTTTKDTRSEAIRSAMLHNEIDQKLFLNDNAMEQRRQQRDAKRKEVQMSRLSNSKF